MGKWLGEERVRLRCRAGEERNWIEIDEEKKTKRLGGERVYKMRRGKGITREDTLQAILTVLKQRSMGLLLIVIKRKVKGNFQVLKY